MVCHEKGQNSNESRTGTIGSANPLHPRAGLAGQGRHCAEVAVGRQRGQTPVPAAEVGVVDGDQERQRGAKFVAMKRESESGVFEIKFPVPQDRIEAVLAWMRAALHPDPHGTGEHGDSYLVQSVYLDTSNFDVFHKRGSFGRAKFRIRRYGTNPAVFLERKLKRTGVVRKRRVPVEAGELTSLNAEANGKVWAGAWFHHRLALRGLRPVVRMTYRRVARFGDGQEGRFRVTLDRDVRAEKLDTLQAPQPFDAEDLLGGGALLEVKFKDALPAQVKGLLERTGLSSGPFSKYRLGIKSCGLVAEPAAEVESEADTSGTPDLMTGPLASGSAV